MIRGIYEKTTANIMLPDETRMPTFTLLFNTVLEILARVIRQKKKKKGKKGREGERMEVQ